MNKTGALGNSCVLSSSIAFHDPLDTELLSQNQYVTRTNVYFENSLHANLRFEADITKGCDNTGGGPSYYRGRIQSDVIDGSLKFFRTDDFSNAPLNLHIETWLIPTFKIKPVTYTEIGEPVVVELSFKDENSVLNGFSFPSVDEVRPGSYGTAVPFSYTYTTGLYIHDGISAPKKIENIYFEVPGTTSIPYSRIVDALGGDPIPERNYWIGVMQDMGSAHSEDFASVFFLDPIQVSASNQQNPTCFGKTGSIDITFEDMSDVISATNYEYLYNLALYSETGSATAPSLIDNPVSFGGTLYYFERAITSGNGEVAAGGSITIADLPAGKYRLKAYILNTGGEALFPGTVDFEITQPTEINPGITFKHNFDGGKYHVPTGASSAEIYITPTGGRNVAYEYAFNSSFTSPKTISYGGTEIENRPEGTPFQVWVRQGAECNVHTASIAFDAPPDMVLGELTFDSTLCHTANTSITNTGTAELAYVLEGLPPYSYALYKNGASFKTGSGLLENQQLILGQVADGLDIGNYRLELRDATVEVPINLNFTIHQPDELIISEVNDDPIPCSDDLATIRLTALGGNGTYSYAAFLNGSGPNVHPSPTSSVYTDLQPNQNYTWRVIDSKSCTVEMTDVTISPPSAITLIGTPTAASCHAAGNGQLELTPSGGTPGSNGYYIHGSASMMNSRTLTDLPVGDLTVRIEDANNCVLDQSFTISSLTDTLEIIQALPKDQVCDSRANGWIEVDIDPGANPAGAYTYELDGVFAAPPSSNQSYLFENLAAGNYTLRVTDALGCTDEQAVSVGLNASQLRIAPADISATNTICPGINLGKMQAAASNGFPGSGYTYRLQGHGIDQSLNGSGMVEFENLPVGNNFTLTVQDDSLCTVSLGSLQVGSDPTPVHFEVEAIRDQSCLSVSDAFVRLKASTLAAGSIVNIETGGDMRAGDTYLIENLPAQTLNFRATDNSGCQNDTSIVLVNRNNDPVLNMIERDSVACLAASNGRFLFGASNATFNAGPYEFRLESSSQADVAQAEFTNLSSGDYNLTVTDTSGCATSANYNIPVIRNPLNIDEFTIDPASCVRAANGQVNLRAAGSIASEVVYSWEVSDSRTANGSSINFDNLIVGQPYEVTLTDQFGCQDQTPAFVVGTISDTININLESTLDASCPGYNDGQAALRALNGNPAASGFDYRIFDLGTGSYVQNVNGSANFTATGLPMGTYRAEVEDQDNCLASLLFEIYEPDPVQSLHDHSFVRRKGDLTAWSELSPTDGNGRYNIEWYTGNSAAPANLVHSETASSPTRLDGLGAGDYLVRVQDTAQCVFWDDAWYEHYFTIEEPEFDLSVQQSSFTQVSCNGLSDGQMTMSASGGWSGNYRFGLDTINMANDAQFAGLAAGDYTFYVRDSENVLDSVKYTMTEPELLAASLDHLVDASCFASTDGEIHLNIAGGNADYEVSNDQTNWYAGDVLAGLGEGDYTVYVRDPMDCQTSIAARVNQPSEIEVTGESIRDTRCQKSDGSVSVTIGGGVPGYQYSWADMSGQSISGQEAISELFSGQYTLTITDAHACEKEFSFFVSDITNLEIADLQTEAVSCFGGSNGTASVQIAQGFPPYEIQWTGGATGTEISGLASDTYMVSVFDSEGCKVFQEFTIDSPEDIGIEINSMIDPLCLGVADGTIDVQATGGTPNYAYLWDNGRNRASISNLDRGNYHLIVEDDHGCTKEFDFSLAYQRYISSELRDEVTLCQGNSMELEPGLFEFYEWRKQNDYLSQEPTLLVSEPGRYYLDFEDADGCQSTDSITVTVSETELQSQYLMASEIHLNDTVIIFETSQPIPDSVRFAVDEGLQIIDQTDYTCTIVPTQEGTFEIQMMTYLHNCMDILSKAIHVLPADADKEFTQKSASLIKSFKLYPNPSNGEFEVELELNAIVDAHLRVVSNQNGIILDDRWLRGTDIFLESYNMQSVQSGLYILHLKVGKERHAIKFIIH